MKIQNVNNQQSFNANVHVDQSVAQLGGKALENLSKAFPKLIALEDAKTDFFIRSHGIADAVPTEVLLEASKKEDLGVNKLVDQSFLKGLVDVGVDVREKQVFSPVSEESFVEAAKQALAKIDSNIGMVKAETEKTISAIRDLFPH